jgi:hypothetical protein
MELYRWIASETSRKEIRERESESKSETERERQRERERAEAAGGEAYPSFEILEDKVYIGVRYLGSSQCLAPSDSRSLLYATY